MKSPFEETEDTVAQFLWNRRGTVCTMCRKIMPDGYCVDTSCSTYPAHTGELFILRFRYAIASTRGKFKKRASLKPKHSKVVSGGRVESKRRKH